MQRPSKRPIILMELLVALVLIGAILSLLLKFFSNTLQMDRKIDALRQESYSREHLQIRLLHIFTSIIPRSSLPAATHASLYSLDEESSGIAAIFDNGIDPDPRFSGAVQGKIYLDEKKNLFLSLHPLDGPKPTPCRKELLLQNIEKLEFQFLSKRSTEMSQAGFTHALASFEWRKTWPKDRFDIPSLIRVIAKMEENELAFAFSLPFADPITYERAKT